MSDCNFIIADGGGPWPQQVPPFNPDKSILAGLTTAQLYSNLAAAQNAYNLLMIGGQVVKATYTQGDGTKEVEFKPANAGFLVGYIGLIQSQLGLVKRARRPMRFFTS